MQVLWFLTLLWAPLVQAGLVNVTVDDTNGDPLTGQHVQYFPPDAWNLGGSCPACTAQPLITSTYQQTYHDGTFNPQPGSNNYPNEVLTLTLSEINATALYVYCVLAHSTSSPDGNSDMSFFLDSEQVGAYTVPADGSSLYSYNVLVYSNASVSAGMHTFQLKNGHPNGEKALVIFDYLVYSYDDGKKAEQPQSVPAHKSDAGVIAGAVLGTVVGLLLIGLLSWYLLRRRNRRNSTAKPLHSAPLEEEVHPIPRNLEPNRARWTQNQLVAVVSMYSDEADTEPTSGSGTTAPSLIETTERHTPTLPSQTHTRSMSAPMLTRPGPSRKPPVRNPLPPVPDSSPPVSREGPIVPNRYTVDLHDGRRPPSYRPSI